MDETRQILFQTNSEMKRAFKLELKQNEILRNVIIEEKQRFILPSDPHALIDLQNLGFSQNQIRRLDRYLLKTSNKRLIPTREKNFREADKIAELDGLTSIECGVSEAKVGNNQVKTRITYWYIQPIKLKSLVMEFVRLKKIVFWPGQPLNKIRLAISADSYGIVY